MAVPPTKEKRIKRLEKQLKKHANNPKMQKKIKGRIASVKGQKEK